LRPRKPLALKNSTRLAGAGFAGPRPSENSVQIIENPLKNIAATNAKPTTLLYDLAKGTSNKTIPN
jgi:hypothetical protein